MNPTVFHPNECALKSFRRSCSVQDIYFISKHLGFLLFFVVKNVYMVGYSTPSEIFLKKYMIQCVYINLYDVLCKIVFHLYLNSPSVGSNWVHRPMWFGRSLRKLSIYITYDHKKEEFRCQRQTASRKAAFDTSQILKLISPSTTRIYPYLSRVTEEKKHNACRFGL